MAAMRCRVKPDKGNVFDLFIVGRGSNLSHKRRPGAAVSWLDRPFARKFLQGALTVIERQRVRIRTPSLELIVSPGRIEGMLLVSLFSGRRKGPAAQTGRAIRTPIRRKRFAAGWRGPRRRLAPTLGERDADNMGRVSPVRALALLRERIQHSASACLCSADGCHSV
jgi:hypothetical protein